MTTATHRKMLRMAGTLESTRVVTDEGYLMCTATISAEGVYPFRSNELDGADGDMAIKQVLLPADVLFNEKTIQDVSILPTTDGHPGPDVAPQNYTELATGHVLSGTVGRGGPGKGLQCKLLITRPDAIEKIQSHQVEEVSLGFYADTEPSDGSLDGQDYSEKFTGTLNVNHVAIVPRGRAGHQVRIHNAMPEDMPDVNAAMVKAITAMKVKRLNMAELTPEDLENVIWSDPQKEAAAGEVAAREAARKTTRDFGPRPVRGPGMGQWDEVLNQNQQLYEQTIRGKVKNAARLAKAKNLLSVALTTGLTAVLADHIWDGVFGSMYDEADGEERMDMAPVGRGARIAGRYITLDAHQRFARFGSRIFQDPELDHALQNRVRLNVIKMMDDNRATMGKRTRDRAPSDERFQQELGGDLGEDFFRGNPSAAYEEVQSQYKELYQELYNIEMEKAAKVVRKQVWSEVTIMAGTVAIFTAGTAFVSSKLGEIRDKVIDFINAGGIDSSGGRADMAPVNDVDQLQAMKARMKEKLKPIIPGAKKGYPKGFVHGTIGGTLLGGLLGFGVGTGFSAASGLLGGGEEAMPPVPGYYYPEDRYA